MRVARWKILYRDKVNKCTSPNFPQILDSQHKRAETGNRAHHRQCNRTGHGWTVGTPHQPLGDDTRVAVDEAAVVVARLDRDRVLE